MKEIFKKILADKISLVGLGIFLFFLIFNLGFLIFNFPQLPPQIPLFYSRPWGEEQLAQKGQLFLLPGISLLVFFLNLLGAIWVFPQRLFLRILIWGATIFGGLATFTLMRIINLLL